MEQALNPTDWYMKLLAPLSPDMKLDLIGRLLDSLKEKKALPGKNIPTSADSRLYARKKALLNKVNGAWCDDELTAAEEIKQVHEARVQGRTRNNAEL